MTILHFSLFKQRKIQIIINYCSQPHLCSFVLTQLESGLFKCWVYAYQNCQFSTYNDCMSHVQDFHIICGKFHEYNLWLGCLHKVI